MPIPSMPAAVDGRHQSKLDTLDPVRPGARAQEAAQQVAESASRDEVKLGAARTSMVKV